MYTLWLQCIHTETSLFCESSWPHCLSKSIGTVSDEKIQRRWRVAIHSEIFLWQKKTNSRDGCKAKIIFQEMNPFQRRKWLASLSGTILRGGKASRLPYLWRKVSFWPDFHAGCNSGLCNAEIWKPFLMRRGTQQENQEQDGIDHSS